MKKKILTFAFKLGVFSIRLPSLLHKALTARLAVEATRVMLAQADQRARRIKRLAASRMSIANTPTANQYFTNTIKILLPKNCIIINELFIPRMISN